MILGQGNVALDVARILLTPPEQLEVSGQVRGGRGGGGHAERKPLLWAQGSSLHAGLSASFPLASGSGLLKGSWELPLMQLLLYFQL